MRRQLQAAAAQRAAPRAPLADSRLLLPLPRSRDPITVGGSYPTVTTTAMESDVQSKNPPSLRQGPRNEGICCVLAVGVGGWSDASEPQLACGNETLRATDLSVATERHRGAEFGCDLKAREDAGQGGMERGGSGGGGGHVCMSPSPVAATSRLSQGVGRSEAPAAESPAEGVGSKPCSHQRRGREGRREGGAGSKCSDLAFRDPVQGVLASYL